ncbi:MAG: hypothetical protein ACREJ0_20910 [Geminicoccaceae bacterium]
MKVGLPRLGSWRRSLALAALLLVIAFAALELYPRVRQPWPYRADVYDEEGNLLTARDLEDPLLGYVPRPDRRLRMRGYYEDRPVLDFAYSIDENGLRVSSPDPRIESDRCILFFGGSTPFGEGVPDDETVPYRIATAFDGTYKVYNFGYFYYGGHQMLAEIEANRLENILECEPAYAIYFGYVVHVQRASYSGVPYSERIPQYVLNEQGVPVLDHRSDVLMIFMDIVRSSRVLRKLDRIAVNALESGGMEREDVDRYIEIVDKARRILESRYPDIEFHIIFWNEAGEEPSAHIIRNFQDRGIPVYLISDIFPNYDYSTMKYSLGPEYMVNDVTWHINGWGYERIAEYIAAKIVN